MRVVGIIQARMGSTRFPGKMLARLAGRPLLWHVIARMRMAVSLDDLVLATSDAPGDDILAMFAKGLGLAVVRGPEENVLERFAKAAEARQADVIVRINGDAPLVDPSFTDRLVTALIDQDADHVGVPAGTPCFHDGIDPMSRRILERLHAEAGADPMAREHVTGYLKQHPEYGRRAEVEVETQLRYESPRLSVDVPADLAFFEELYRRFEARPGHLDLRLVAAAFAAGRLERASGGGRGAPNRESGASGAGRGAPNRESGASGAGG
jgi:spore coat polysaccharide biosynthesis protein SpsF